MAEDLQLAAEEEVQVLSLNMEELIHQWILNLHWRFVYQWKKNERDRRLLKRQTVEKMQLDPVNQRQQHKFRRRLDLVKMMSCNVLFNYPCKKLPVVLRRPPRRKVQILKKPLHQLQLLHLVLHSCQ